MFILNALLARLAIINAYRQTIFSIISLNDVALKQIGFKQNEISKISRTISFGG